MIPHPDDEYWLKAHIRFTQGHFAAWEEIAQYFLPVLTRKLSCRQRHMDEHFAAQSSENALLDYWGDPQRFDVTCGVPMRYWLLMQARGHLSNLLRGEGRHRAHERAAGVADKVFEIFLSQISSRRTIYRRGNTYELQDPRPALDAMLLRLSHDERVEVEMVRRGVPLKEWVEELGIARLTTAEQRRRINTEKSRLKKKLRRLAQHLGSTVAL